MKKRGVFFNPCQAGSLAHVEFRLNQQPVLRFTKQLSINPVNLMFDCDDAGNEGAWEALWFFAEHKLDVRLLWSPTMHGGEHKGRQPEVLSHSGVESLFAR